MSPPRGHDKLEELARRLEEDILTAVEETPESQHTTRLIHLAAKARREIAPGVYLVEVPKSFRNSIMLVFTVLFGYMPNFMNTHAYVPELGKGNYILYTEKGELAVAKQYLGVAGGRKALAIGSPRLLRAYAGYKETGLILPGYMCREMEKTGMRCEKRYTYTNHEYCLCSRP